MQANKTDSFEACAMKDQLEKITPIEPELPQEPKKPEKPKPKHIPNHLPKYNELVFVRLIDPIHIPSYLVEQIKDRDYSVDKFYDYQRMLCLQQTQKGHELNPFNFLYAIVNDKLKQVKGFLWATLDFLTNCLVINHFSMDKEYWFQGKAIDLLEEKVKKIKKDLDIDKIVWITPHPNLCEKRGFKRSKDIVMVYEGD